MSDILHIGHPWCVVQRKSKVWVSFRIIAEEVSQMVNLGRQLKAIPLCFIRQGNREAEGLCLGRSVLRRCLSRPTVLRGLIFNDMQWYLDMRWHAMTCNDMQWCAMLCSDVQCYAVICTDMQYYGLICTNVPNIHQNALICTSMMH